MYLLICTAFIIIFYRINLYVYLIFIHIQIFIYIFLNRVLLFVIYPSINLREVVSNDSSFIPIPCVWRVPFRLRIVGSLQSQSSTRHMHLCGNYVVQVVVHLQFFFAVEIIIIPNSCSTLSHKSKCNILQTLWNFSNLIYCSKRLWLNVHPSYTLQMCRYRVVWAHHIIQYYIFIKRQLKK